MRWYLLVLVVCVCVCVCTVYVCAQYVCVQYLCIVLCYMCVVCVVFHVCCVLYVCMLCYRCLVCVCTCVLAHFVCGMGRDPSIILPPTDTNELNKVTDLINP